MARARLDWLKRMPEMAGGGGGEEGGGNSRLHRESLGQLGNNNNIIINLYFPGIRLYVLKPSFFTFLGKFFYKIPETCFLRFKLRSKTFGTKPSLH